MNNKSKEQLIEDGILQGITHFTKRGVYNFKNKYENPINVFGNIMNSDKLFEFRKKLSVFIFNKYENVSLEELKIKAVSKILGRTDKQLVEIASNEVVVNYISLEVINKINDIYSKLRKQSEIIFKELEV